MTTKHRVSSDWDVEQYRNEWENDAQWNLRKQFMLAYKDTIPEGKLICWAQVYGNVEAYQCRYPVEVMDQVKKLAANLDARRQQQVNGPKSRIVFVKEASNTTVSSNNNTGSEERLENRKRKGTPLDEESGQDVCNTKYLNGEINLSDQFVHKLPREYQLQSFQGCEHNLSQEEDRSHSPPLETSCYTEKRVIIPLVFQEDLTSSYSYLQHIKHNPNQFNNFVILIDENFLNRGVEHMLKECGKFNKMFCNFKIMKNLKHCGSDKRFTVVVRFNRVIVGEGSSLINEEARRLASKSALINLSQVASTLIVKANIPDPNKMLTKMSLGVVPVEEEGNCITNDAISESNVGHKMLRIMGWSGGGLGRIGNEGITEPIKVTTQKWSRKGLGLPESSGAKKFALKKFKQRLTAVFREFSSTSIDNVLLVSTDFNQEQKALIHEVSRKFKLHGTRSRKDKNEGIFITIRHMSPDNLKRHALLHGGLSDKYEVLPPGLSWPRIKEILKLDDNLAETIKEDIKPLTSGQDVRTENVTSGMNLSDQLVHKLPTEYQLQSFQGYEHKLSQKAEKLHLMNVEVLSIKSDSPPLTTPCYTEQKEDVTSAGSYDKDIKQNITPFNNFVIVIDENILRRRIEPMFQQWGAFNNVCCRLRKEVINDCGSEKRYVVEFDNVIVGEGSSVELEEAKRQAAKSTLMKLSQVAYTLIVKVNIVDRNKWLTRMSLGLAPEEEGNCFTDDANFLASKFPVKSFRQRIIAVLKEFSSTNIDNVLIVSTEFNNEERLIIYEICSKFKLHTSSRRSDNKKGIYLTIRHMSPDDLKRHALLHGGLSDKYEVLPPGSSWSRIKDILKFDENVTETTKDGIKPLKTGQDVRTENGTSGMNLSDQRYEHKLSEKAEELHLMSGDVSPIKKTTSARSYDLDFKQNMTQFNLINLTSSV